MADTGKSTLHSLTLTDTVDVATDPFLAFTANVSDPDGIHSFQLNFAKRLLGSIDSLGNPSYPLIWGYDSWNSGAMGVRYQINTINEPGAYVLDSVTIVDRQYNITSINTEQLRALGVDTGFTLAGSTPDRTVPVLESLNLPAVIDTSKGPAVWRITGKATDDLSGPYAIGIAFDRGLKQAGWFSDFSKPDISHYHDNNSAGIFGPDLDSGNASTAYWIAAPNGVYGVDYVWVTDHTGNVAQFSQSTLRDMGVNTQIVVSDGHFVAPTLTGAVSALPRTADADGALVVSLSANQWRDTGNSIELTIDYDATQARFDGWRAGSEGAYTLTAQTLEVGIMGQTRISGTIDNKGDHSGFLDLRFKPSSSSGSFGFDLSRIKINGAMVLDSLDQSHAYRIQTLASGSAQADVLAGTDGDDYLQGLGGADVFKASAGFDTFDGGEGRDSAHYAGKREDYAVTREGGKIVVASKLDPADIDHLHSVETIAFGDLRMDFDADGHAAQIFRLFQAAFDRAPKASGLGFWVKAAENGVSMHHIASQFVASEEFRTIHAKDPSNAAIVDSFYRNALDRAPDLPGFQSWTVLLDRKERDVADVLLGFSESLENRQNTADLIGQGMTYLPA